MAKVLARELDQFRLMFIEEPVLSQNNEALREIARATTTPISTGERMFSRWDFKQIFEDGYVDIIQPDLSHAGGISECRKIIAMAEAYDIAVAPHCPLGPIALGACFQVDTCSPNVFIQEQSLGIHYNRGGDLLDYLKDPTIYHYNEGYLELMHAPALGLRSTRRLSAGRPRTPPPGKIPSGAISTAPLPSGDRKGSSHELHHYTGYRYDQHKGRSLGFEISPGSVGQIGGRCAQHRD